MPYNETPMKGTAMNSPIKKITEFTSENPFTSAAAIFIAIRLVNAHAQKKHHDKIMNDLLDRVHPSYLT